MTTQELLAQLKERIQSLHAEDWKAFELLAQRLMASRVPLQCQVADLPPVTAPSDAFDDADAESLIGSVERVFESHPEIPWSVVSLEKQLRKEAFAFQAKNPRSSLNTAVGRLVQRGIIGIYKKGSGRRPNLYKTFPSGNAAALRGRWMAEDKPELFANGQVGEVVEEEAESQLSTS